MASPRRVRSPGACLCSSGAGVCWDLLLWLSLQKRCRWTPTPLGSFQRGLVVGWLTAGRWLSAASISLEPGRVG